MTHTALLLLILSWLGRLERYFLFRVNHVDKCLELDQLVELSE
jgi:hypothetical protein